MPYLFEGPKILVNSIKALLGFNRLEARPRNHEFNRGLRAEIRDPVWLLARQWQMKEFKAEDRGSPAFAEVVMEQLPVSQLTLAAGKPVPYDVKQQPLEAAVEAQPVPNDVGLSFQMGQHWLQMLRTLHLPAQKLKDYTAFFYSGYPLKSPAPDSRAYALEQTTAEIHELLQIAGNRAIDGYALYMALLQRYSGQLDPLVTNPDAFKTLIITLPLYRELPGSEGLNDPGMTESLNKLSQQFVLAFYRLYFHGAAISGWSIKDMAYSFSMTTETGSKGQVTLTSSRHQGGDLHWYALDQQPTTRPAAPATSMPAIKKRFLPTEIQFPGSPNARWWEFEDRKIDFGALTGDPSDFGRMLLQEFIFLYQNDWFSVPFEVPVGMFCTVDSLTVTDVFGTSYRLQPAGAGQFKEPENGNRIDFDAGRWQLFNQTNPVTTDAPPHLFLPPTAVAPMTGKPVEQVGFRREEATNLMWAIEQTIPNGFMRGMDGQGAAAMVTEYMRSDTQPEVVPAGARYLYQPESPVAENWIPFVAGKDEKGVYHLEQATMQQQYINEPNKTVKPRTSLLQLPDLPYLVHEHEIPLAGMRIDSAFRRVRWFNGRTILWFGRSRGAAPAGGSSGLVFDQLITSGSTT